jgi:HAMP domain-containing protein
MLAPLVDYAGKVAGVLQFTVSRDTLLGEIARARNTGLLIGIILTVVSLLVMWQIALWVITKPVGHITEVANQISRGDLDVSIEVTSQDEIGDLAEAIERMRTSLKLAMQRLQSRRSSR